MAEAVWYDVVNHRKITGKGRLKLKSCDLQDAIAEAAGIRGRYGSRLCIKDKTVDILCCETDQVVAPNVIVHGL